MEKKVQGIIIKDNKVLMVQGVGENGRKDNFFISGVIKEGEGEVDSINRVLKEQINLDANIVLKFHKELVNDIKTFLIELDEDIELDYDIENVKCLNDYYKPSQLKWIELEEKRSFREFETHYLRLLLEEYIKINHKSQAMDIIKNTYFISKSSKAYIDNLYIQNEKNKVDSQETMSNKAKVIFMAIGLGILFDYFFTGDFLGISTFIFTMAVIISTIYGVYNQVKLNEKMGIIFIIPIILLSLSFSIYNDIVLRSLNVIIVPILITGYLITIRYQNAKEINLYFILSIFSRIFIKTLETLPKFFVFSKEVTKSRKKVKENSIQKNIIRGLLLSVPLLIIIVILLSSADMMFKYYVENIGNIFGEFSFSSALQHIIIIMATSLYIFGFLWSFKYNKIYCKNTEIKKIKASWEPVTVLTILFVINIAYLLFTIVQLSYLYGGGMNALPEGFSYAEYARRGFFELILVTIINFIILILSMNLTRRSSSKTNNLINISFSLLIIFTFNMLVSASYKMHIYEKAFGFTRLRVFVQAFMILLGILLIIVLLGLWNKKIPILKYAFIATLIVYITLNFVNINGIIAKENISRYEATGKIDVRYIKRLSYDAMPEVIKLLEAEEPQIRNEIQEHLKNEKEILVREYDHWYEFNYYKSKFVNSKVKLDI